MYVRNHMSRPPVTVDEGSPAAEAFRILLARGFRHLPVVDGQGRLTGILSDRDRRSWEPSALLPAEERQALLLRLEEKPVRDVMTDKPRRLTLSSTLDDALYIFEREGIGALPVTDGGGRVAGVFSVQDLIRAYGEAFGLAGGGSVLVEVEDDGGGEMMTRIATVLDERKIPLYRLTRAEGRGERPALVTLRLSTCNLHALHEAFGKVGLKIILDRPERDDVQG